MKLNLLILDKLYEFDKGTLNELANFLNYKKNDGRIYLLKKELEKLEIIKVEKIPQIISTKRGLRFVPVFKVNYEKIDEYISKNLVNFSSRLKKEVDKYDRN